MSKKALHQGLENLLKQTKKSVEILEELVRVSKEKNSKLSKTALKADKKVTKKAK